MHAPLRWFTVASTLASLAVSGLGCSEASCEETLTCDVPDPAPTITSVSPANGTTGLGLNTTILVTFSRAMDRAATQNAFQSSTLTNPSFDWIDDRTVEIIPGQLEYAEGDRDVAPLQYDYRFTDRATDTEGNPLDSELTLFSFSTSRRVVEVLSVTEVSVQADGSDESCFNQPGLWRVGKVGTEDCRNLMNVDLSLIPPGADIEQAQLSCSYLDVVNGTPSWSTLETVTFEPSNLAAGWSTPALDTIPDPLGFSQVPQEQFSADVGAALEAELAGNTPESLQLRLTVDSIPEGSFLVWRSLDEGGCADGLHVTYLVP